MTMHLGTGSELVHGISTTNNRPWWRYKFIHLSFLSPSICLLPPLAHWEVVMSCMLVTGPPIITTVSSGWQLSMTD